MSEPDPTVIWDAFFEATGIDDEMLRKLDKGQMLLLASYVGEILGSTQEVPPDLIMTHILNDPRKIKRVEGAVRVAYLKTLNSEKVLQSSKKGGFTWYSFRIS